MKFPSRLVRVWFAFLALLLTPLVLRAQTNDIAWSIAVIDRILANLPPGAAVAQAGDMVIPVTTLQAWRSQLAGGPQPLFTVGSGATLWPGGNVYYVFTNTLTTDKQRAFTNAAMEWSLFANVHFIPRTTQASYMFIMEDPALQGGLSAVGMVGPAQTFHIGPNAWNRGTLVHEVGHTLGLVHEHQRLDRTNFLTVISNNIAPGQEFNFTLLTTATNHGAYDFLSVMHYAHNAFSVNTATLDTMVPLPAYSQYYSVMGHGNPVLSVSDRTNMAAIYGATAVPVTNVVTNTQDTGPGSLRAAIYYGFDHPGTTISFNISTNDPGYTNGVFTLQPVDELPGLANGTVIDGSTEPVQLNPNGPAIQINGALPISSSGFACGIRFIGTNCAVRSLVINGFADSSIRMDGTNVVGNTVSGCYLGIDPSGNNPVTNGFYPVYILNGANGNTIGGTAPAARNIISGGSLQGVLITDPGTKGNVIKGNYIGLNAAGTLALPNGTSGSGYSGVGIFSGAQSNIIGGTAVGARNVISGNTSQGVVIADTGSTGNIIEGNYIGLNPAGTGGISNDWAGVQIAGGAQGNIVGPSNVISGNGNQGVLISDSGTTGNLVAGNWAGLNAAGTGAVPNGYSGVGIANGAQSNLIGGTTPGARNVLSGNAIQGVVLQDAGTAHNVVEGNYLGLNPAGTAAIGNTGAGVEIYNGPNGNVIGGIGGARNFMSGNGDFGVVIDFGNAFANIVQGNTIGLDAANRNAFPNAQGGVLLYVMAESNQIGGVTPGAANLIAGNSSVGVYVYDSTATNNSIRGNSIYNNGTGNFGIYLSTGGNTPATPPALNSAAVGVTNTAISGTLAGLPGTLFHLDFYANPGPSTTAQARDFLGTLDVTTSGGGSVTFTNTQAPPVPLGQIIQATATDPSGNTSALSNPVSVGGTDSVGDGIPNAWRVAFFGGSGTTTNSTNCATCDPDHDGMNNLAEFLSGTNPTNAASALRLAAPTLSGTNVNVGFPSVKGVPYRIMYRDDLATSSWSIFEDQVSGTGTSLFITDPGAALLPKRFYQVQVFP